MKGMKRLLSLMMAIVLVLRLVPQVSAADDWEQAGDYAKGGSSDSYIYELEGNWAIITGYEGIATSLTIPSKLDGYDVIAIGDYAFEYNTKIASVRIQENIRWIGSGAFSGCTNLQNVEISANITEIREETFCDCTKLFSVEIPSTVTGIGWSAFSNCTSLASITLPDSVTFIGGYAFSNTGLTYLTLPQSLIVSEECILANTPGVTEITIPKTVEYAADAFADSSIREMYFEAGIPRIPEKLANNAAELEVVTIPSTVTEIGWSAFSNCTSLESITLPDSVIFIGGYAFSNTGLTSLTLPKNLVVTEECIVMDTSGITEITIPKTIQYATDTFAYSSVREMYFEEGITRIPEKVANNASELEVVTIPSTVTEIGWSAFANCTSLESITLPDSVIFIGGYAFSNTGLTSLTLPKNLVVTEECILKDTPGVTEITIPKTVKNASDTFANSSIREMYFEEGIPRIPEKVANDVAELEAVTIPSTVTEIGWSAFSNCTSLESITLPDSVTFIGGYAFTNTGLTSLTLPKNLITLENCILENTSGVTEITIPKTVKNAADAFANSSIREIYFENGITEIPAAMANYATELEAVTIPDSVTSIGAYAFANTGLTSLTLPKNLVTLGVCILENTPDVTEITIPKTVEHAVDAFANSSIQELHFEEGITLVPDAVAKYATKLTKVTIPDTVKIIEGAAFEGCHSLEEIQIPDSVIEMDSYVFYECTALKSVVIPDSVEWMGDAMFYGCRSLTDVTLPNIGQNVVASMFEGCTALEKIVLPATVTTIQSHAFKNCTALKEIVWSDNLSVIEEYAFENCDSLNAVSIPDGVQEIYWGVFYDCDGLTSIEFPDSVAYMGGSVFYDCDALTNVDLGSGITEISEFMFEHCDVLQNLTIPRSVKKIHNGAFIDCVKFTEITIPRSVEEIENSAFSYRDILTIYGVAGTYAETFAEENGIAFVDCQINAEQVALDQTELKLQKGKFAQLKLTVTPEDFTDAVVWKSGNPDVAVVSENGEIEAVGIGSTVIKVTVGNVSASCKVTVYQGVEWINLNEYRLTMDALDTYQLTAEVCPEDAEVKSVTWSTSDESVAAVSEDGLVTAVGKGTADITATAENGISETCTVTVANNGSVAEDPEELESSHNYPNNCSDFWIYTIPGAEKLAITFHEQTQLEDGFDYLLIFDGEGNQIGQYTGTELAGATITVPGDTVKIQILSDDSGNSWGFKVDAISEYVHVHEYEKEITDPTCTDRGYTTFTCECGDSYVGEYVKPLDHSWDNGVITVEPEVGAEGIKTFTCGKCGETKTESIPALEAPEETKPTEPEVCKHASTKLLNQKDATCTATGYTGDKVCVNCGEIVEKGTTIQKKAHTEVVDMAVAATCTSTGKTEGKHCSVCQTVLVKQESVAPKGHNWGEWKVTKPATGAEMGEEVRSCIVCGAEETRSIDKLSNPFVDVLPGKFYETAVLWAVETGATNGMDATHFAPNDKCTRAQVVTFLWRAAGSPEPTSNDNPFVDVIEGKFYYKAVLWAVENGITNGVDATHFGTNDECTRGHVATFLWRTLGKPSATGSNPFEDVPAGKFYYDAVLWAAESGVTTGVSAGKFDPNGTCTRGQIVTFLYRALG